MMHLPDAASSSYRRGDHPKRQDQESGKLAEGSFQVPNINVPFLWKESKRLKEFGGMKV